MPRYIALCPDCHAEQPYQCPSDDYERERPDCPKCGKPGAEMLLKVARVPFKLKGSAWARNSYE